MKRHRPRCPDCKQAVEKLLRGIYGAVEPGWASGWPCRIEDVRSKGVAAILVPIYDALVAHRGHVSFVRSRKLARCDYFVPGHPGFLVEYDEAQHFTAPRAVTLSRIPNSNALGFRRARWLELCGDIDSRDNDPPFRDEQRAWYDVLRDVLPIEFGFAPTARLLDRELAYCELDPGQPEQLKTFKAMLGRP